MTNMQDLISGKDFDELLTEEEVIELLRLDVRPNPKESLRYQIRKHGLPYVDFGRGLRRFTKVAVQEFIERKLVTHKGL